MPSKKTFLFAFFFCALSMYSYAQKMGNEWVDFDKQYFKLRVNEDGIYRLSTEELKAIGIEAQDLIGEELQIWNNGIQTPILVSTNVLFGPSDYIEFYGQKNTVQLDTLLYSDWKNELLNTEYSFFTDESAYFLTFAKQEIEVEDLVKRYEQLSYDFDMSDLSLTDYYIHEEKVVYSDVWYKPQLGNSVQLSHFVSSEGYASKLDKVSNHIIETEDLRSDVDEKAFFSYRLGSNGNSGQTIDVTLNDTHIGSESKSRRNSLFTERQEVAVTDILSSNKIVLTNSGNVNGKHRVAYVSLSYPRNLDAKTSATFNFSHLGNEKLYALNIEGEQFTIFNTSTGSLIPWQKNNEKLLFYVDGDSLDHIVILNQMAPRLNVLTGHKIDFVDFSKINPDVMFLTSKRLEVQSYNGENIIDKYVRYRKSDAGGNHNLAKIYIEDLYDQFGYGVDFHHIVYKNFYQFTDSIWTNLESAYIIGKSYEYFNMRNRQNLESAKYFVPTYGHPGSDALMFSEGKYPTSKLNIGRIAASTQEDLSNYLDKVIRYENLPNLEHSVDNAFWKKKIIHLSGGGNAGEQTSISNYLDRMDDVIKDSQFGGEVQTFYKESSDPIQAIDKGNITTLINNGISMITFFGHSSVRTFDLGIDDPSEYNNMERLPIITSLGCYSGNINTPNGGISERYVLYKDQGSIAFLASAGSAYLNDQGLIGRDMYELLGNTGYGRPFSETLKNLRLKYGNTNAFNYLSLFQQFTYHGDPLISLPHYDVPDYTLDPETIITNPKEITSINDEFDLEFDLLNLGIRKDDTLEIMVVNTSIKTGKNDSLLYYVSGPSNKSEISLTIPIDANNNKGNNDIQIIIDPFDKIIERPSPVAEQNNIFGSQSNSIFSYFVLDNAVSLVSPNNFGIMTEAKKELIFTTSNALADYEDFILEVDTTIYFDSPLLYKQEIYARGGVNRHQITNDLEQGRVYYWKITRVSTNLGSSDIHSFTYDPGGEPGWRQGHYYQFLEISDSSSIKINEDRNWEFGVSRKELKVDLSITNAANAQLLVNGVNWSSLHPTKFQSALCVFSRNQIPTEHFLHTPENSFGSVKHDIGDIFIYEMDSEDDTKNIKDLLEAIPEGNTIFIYTYLRSPNSSLSTERWQSDSINLGYNLYSILESYGASEVREFSKLGTVPYLFSFVKGRGFVYEEIATSIEDRLTTTLGFDIRNTKGSITSNIIGPGSIWKNIEIKSQDDDIFSSVTSVNGYDLANQKLSFIDENPDINIDLSNVNEYGLKNIQFEIEGENSQSRTPRNYSSFRVSYEPGQELALNFTDSQYNTQHKITKGDIIKIEGYVHNLTNVVSSPSVLTIVLDDRSGNKIEHNLEINEIEAHDSTLFSLEVESQDFNNDIYVVYFHNKSNDPLERIILNNYASQIIRLSKDSENPILNVTFDQINIEDYDYISSNAVIDINLYDENKISLLSESDLANISIVDKDGNTIEYSEANNNLEFYPSLRGDSNNALFRIAGDFEDGQYTLLVNARDVEGNKPGNGLYQINFIVRNDKTISEVVSYPNPFMDYTFFNFTITGEIPQDFELVIFDNTGKILKRFNDNELKLGYNSSNFKWDGTDASGNKLSSGVYYYKVIINEDYRLFTPSGSVAKFNEIYNKVVIVR